MELPRSGPRSWGFPRSSPRPHTHNGIDLPGRAGDPVYAADGGVVEHATPNEHEGVDPGFSGYGRVVVVRSADSTRQLYAHLLATDAAQGAHVDKGAQLGALGGTAYTHEEPRRTVGPHVHFEVSPRRYPQANTEPRLDPVAWLTAAGAGRVHPVTGERFGEPQSTAPSERSAGSSAALVVSAIVVLGLAALAPRVLRRL